MANIQTILGRLIMRPILFFFILFLNATIQTDASELAAKEFWGKVIENALVPVEGHYIVDIRSEESKPEESNLLQTRFEYWVMRDDFRIDVKDIQGRDLKTQLILKNRGRDVLFNPDSTGSRVVAEENRNNGRGEEERMQWTYFQTLLGRHAFTPLALYRERFLAFERMSDKFSSESIVQGDIRLIRFVNSKGVRFEYSFKDGALNPHKVETILSDGTVWRRLTTDWRDLPSPMEGKVAWSGELVMFAQNGAVSEQQEWIHVLAEKINADEDVFSWTAMNLPVGKKRIIYNQNESETNVAFWDGTQFSDSPLAVPNADGKKQLLIWLGLIGIVVATILTVSKIVSKKG